MPSNETEHPLSYRQEIVGPLFAEIARGDSCAVVGAASMGKSRLISFVMRPDAREHYLGRQAGETLFVHVDCNRLAEMSDWGLYELMLTALTEAAGAFAPLMDQRKALNGLRREVIINHDVIPLLAQRHVELAAHIICAEEQLSICFLLDEFEEPYRRLPARALANLRALRDQNKYRLTFVMFFREPPERLRDLSDSEGMYELFCRKLLWLRPYAEADARLVLAQVLRRRRNCLDPDLTDQVLALAGGHPGLIVALTALACGADWPAQDAETWAAQQPVIIDECRRLWQGLGDAEQLALRRLAVGVGADLAARRSLEDKGLILRAGPAGYTFFSPVFRSFAAAQRVQAGASLLLDEKLGVLWIDGQQIDSLSALEFELLRYLYRNLGRVCSREEILAVLYPNERPGGDAENIGNRVDSLVRHLRQRIEPTPSKPTYLLSVHGRGYRLIDRVE